MEHALMCPQCNAPLTPSRFARSVVCSYCGATVQLDPATVPATKFHDAFRAWNSPESYTTGTWISIGESHWVINTCIAHGDVSDVYTGQRARWPTEFVILKILRDRKDLAFFNNEWEALQALHGSNAPGADHSTRLLPQPVLHGDISNGAQAGKRVSIFRWMSGFYYTFEDVLQTHPQGISPRASIWIWRRILEMLSFIHHSGMVHGAVLPSHLLVQENEHGILLVGYSSAGRAGNKPRIHPEQSESFHKLSKQSFSTLTPQLDLMMSARCILYILGGDPESGALPAAVPKQLADLIQQTALGNPSGAGQGDAWSIREELGSIATDVFGPPQFSPIVMPD